MRKKKRMTEGYSIIVGTTLNVKNKLRFVAVHRSSKTSTKIELFHRRGLYVPRYASEGTAVLIFVTCHCRDQKIPSVSLRKGIVGRISEPRRSIDLVNSLK